MPINGACMPALLHACCCHGVLLSRACVPSHHRNNMPLAVCRLAAAVMGISRSLSQAEAAVAEWRAHCRCVLALDAVLSHWCSQPCPVHVHVHHSCCGMSWAAVACHLGSLTASKAPVNVQVQGWPWCRRSATRVERCHLIPIAGIL